jgi:hypothetical protein
MSLSSGKKSGLAGDSWSTDMLKETQKERRRMSTVELEAKPIGGLPCSSTEHCTQL